MESARRLLVGLGNPGKEYTYTRHNLGFLILDEFAKRKGLSFKKERFFEGEVSRSDQMILLKPSTYMNLSGRAVLALMRKENIPLENLVVVHDEVAHSFGEFRLKVGGSAGGHNGIQSVLEALGTPNFTRLRAGIGPYSLSLTGEILSEFVLSPFGEKEKELLPDVVVRGAIILESVVEKPLNQVMKELHTPISTEKEKN